MACKPISKDNPWWCPGVQGQEEFEVGEFIGQGRKIQYCGLPSAVLESTKGIDIEDASIERLNECSRDVAKRLNGWKPTSWYIIALLSLLLVWCEIMMAFTVSFTAPTIGMGCRTMAYLVFGGSSSVSWIIQFSKRPPNWARRTAHAFNCLAILSLLAVTVFQVCIVLSLGYLVLQDQVGLTCPMLQGDRASKQLLL